jgi:hypothetical protein
MFERGFIDTAFGFFNPKISLKETDSSPFFEKSRITWWFNVLTKQFPVTENEVHVFVGESPCVSCCVSWQILMNSRFSCLISLWSMLKTIIDQRVLNGLPGLQVVLVTVGLEGAIGVNDLHEAWEPYNASVQCHGQVGFYSPSWSWNHGNPMESQGGFDIFDITWYDQLVGWLCCPTREQILQIGGKKGPPASAWLELEAAERAGLFKILVDLTSQ